MYFLGYEMSNYSPEDIVGAIQAWSGFGNWNCSCKEASLCVLYAVNKHAVGNGYKWEFPLWTGTLDAFVKAKFKTGIYNEDLNPRVIDVQSSIFKIQHLGTPAKAHCISQSILVCVCFMYTIIKCLISQIFMHSIWASWDRIIFFNQTAEDPDLEILAWISILLEE